MSWPGILLLFLTFACGASHPSEEAARHFMGAYYVSTDLQGASRYADGLALDKIHSEIGLIEGQTIDRSTRRPRIFYKLLEGQVEGGEGEYLFQVTIRPEDFGEIVKRTRLKVRDRGGSWKVTQFSDYSLEQP